MKKEAILISVLILLLAISLLFPKPLFSPGELSVERDLPDSAGLNQELTVTLNIYTAADKPSAMGITENFPVGWLIGDIQGSDYSKSSESGVELLLFSLTGDVQDTTIIYTITPTTTDSTFSGTWESVSPDDSGDIEGDVSLTINEPRTISPSGGGGGGGGSTLTCKENWICSDWSECENEQKTRTCTDNSGCKPIKNKPLESASCNPIAAAAEQAIDYSKKHPEIPISTALIIAIIVIAIIIIIILKKDKLKKIMKKNK